MTLRQDAFAFGKIPFVKYFLLSGREVAAMIGSTNLIISSQVGNLFCNNECMLFQFTSERLTPITADDVMNSLGRTTVLTEYLKVTS